MASQSLFPRNETKKKSVSLEMLNSKHVGLGIVGQTLLTTHVNWKSRESSYQGWDVREEKMRLGAFCFRPPPPPKDAAARPWVL